MNQSSSRRRRPSRRTFALLGGAALVAVVLAACTDPPLPLRPGPACTKQVPPSKAASAIAAANPGDVLCITTGDLGAARLHPTRDGTSTKRIVLRATGSVTTTGIDIGADYWTVEGFIVKANPKAAAAPGIGIRGVGVAVYSNRAQGGTDYGISCDLDVPCNGARISYNVVTRSVGTGIWVYGNDIIAQANDVSGSVQVGNSDADGFRFFGNRITLRANYIHDIDATA